MQKVEFYVGTIDQDGHSRNLAPADKIIGEQFQGFTRVIAEGYWRGTLEQSAVYTVIVTDALVYPALVASIATQVAREMDQEEVLWTISNIRADFALRGQFYY